MFKYDLHVHTSEVSACAKCSAKDVVKAYKEAGYDGLVITDHYFMQFFEPLGASMPWEEKVERYMKGYQSALETAEALDFTLMLGAEITFYPHMNDHLVFGVTREFLLRYPELYKENSAALYEKAHRHNMLVFQAHPFRTDKMERIDGSIIDGMEIYNGSPRYNPHLEITTEYINSHHLRAISGSDFHDLSGLAKGGIETERRIRNSEELLEILKAGEYRPIIGPLDFNDCQIKSTTIQINKG